MEGMEENGKIKTDQDIAGTDTKNGTNKTNFNKGGSLDIKGDIQRGET